MQKLEIDKVDLSKQYATMKNILKGAKQGEVVTRFPPEPSGFLHIGHVKAALLNFHYSKIYQGKMLLRFDDTNPSKEKQDFVDSILQDLDTLQIKYDQLSYTSDHFDYLMKLMTQLISEGKMYCDNTAVEQMRAERMTGIESKCRSQTIEENLKIWEQMQKGEQDDYCVRAKIDMKALNKCMRDPVMYRSNRTPHHKTGTKYIVYPTYDFACPIVDSLEGVTHALRTNEYSDRIEQYQWVIKAANVRPVEIYEFSRLNLQNTCLSKRKLQWFVDTKKVEGWNDPRFPTCQGILRRGLIVQTLAEFMLEQGPSKNSNLMEWDKLWAINKKNIDLRANRYSAISNDKISQIQFIQNYNQPQAQARVITVPAHPQNPKNGNRVQFRSDLVYIEYDDAKDIVLGDKLTLMKWGNCQITKITQKEDGSFSFEANLMEDDKDFKSTKKINWVSANSPIALINLIELDHLLKVKKVEENMDFEAALNEQTKFYTKAIAEPVIKTLQKGDIVQFERRGFYILDNFDEGLPNFIYIPDGKTKTMSNLSSKVDVAKFSGTNKEINKETEVKQDVIVVEEEKEKSKKQLKREQAAKEKELKKQQHKLNEQELKKQEQ